ncbi:MAG: hypothetical protein ACLSVD_02345 [Eggerthellaceae bacterium]
MQGWMARGGDGVSLMSGLCLLLSWRDAQGRDATAEYRGAAEQRAFAEASRQRAEGLPRVLKSMGRAGFGILAACLFVCVEGSFWSGSSGQDATAAQVALVVSIAFMLMVGLRHGGAASVSLSFLYRWMCPTLVVGFAAFIVLGKPRARTSPTWWHRRALRVLPDHADVFRALRCAGRGHARAVVRFGMDLRALGRSAGW